MVNLDSVKSWWNGLSRIRKGLIIVIVIFLLVWMVGSFTDDNSNPVTSTNISESVPSVSDHVSVDSNLHDTGKMVFEEPGEDWYIKNTDEIDYVRYYRDIGKAQIDVIFCYPYGDFKKTDELELNSLEYMEYVGKSKFNSKIEFYKSQLTSVDMYAYVVTEGDNTFIIEVMGPARDVGMKIAKSIHSK